MSDQNVESKIIIPRYPSNTLEQLDYLPELSKREEICEALFVGISSLLESHGIRINHTRSTFRPKSDERINEKIKRKGVTSQIVDIYGLRIVTEYGDRKRIGNLIQSAYPLTPELFNDGKPTYRDFSDPDFSKWFREKFNSSITERYTSTHINIVFPIQDSPVLAIGEVQIRNLEEADKFEKTYESVYKVNQKNNQKNV